MTGDEQQFFDALARPANPRPETDDAPTQQFMIPGHISEPEQGGEAEVAPDDDGDSSARHHFDTDFSQSGDAHRGGGDSTLVAAPGPEDETAASGTDETGNRRPGGPEERRYIGPSPYEIHGTTDMQIGAGHGQSAEPTPQHLPHWGPGAQHPPMPHPNQRPPWQIRPSDGAPTGGTELRGEQIRAEELIAPNKEPSSHGWRKWLYRATFRMINVGESADEQLVRSMNTAVANHFRGTYSIVVLGGKGGVGKTTATAALGSVFALGRKDNAIVIDANPDRASNLADRVDPKAANSYWEILADRNLVRYTDIRSHVGQNPAGLDVLRNRHYADRRILNPHIYMATHDQLQRFYSVLISDSGTDVDHPVVPAFMERADAIVMVASTAPDGSKGAAELMDWAYERGYHRLIRRMVVVINNVRGGDSKANRKLVESLVEKFSRWVGPDRVFEVPYDPHIATAGVIDVNKLRPETRRRFLEIAAKLASGFSSTEDTP